MFMNVQNLQILRPIIGFDAIDVMHMLYWQESTSKFLFHHPSMFRQSSSIRRTDSTIFMPLFYALCKAVAVLRAIVFYCYSTGRQEELLVASLA